MSLEHLYHRSICSLFDRQAVYPSKAIEGRPVYEKVVKFDCYNIVQCKKCTSVSM